MTNNNVDEDIAWMRRMVSHNVRMPMAIIRGYGDVLRQNLLNEDEKKKAIESICENIVYLDQIINIIFEDGKTEEVMMTEVNIFEILKTVISYMEDMAHNNGLKINFASVSNELYIMAEPIPIIRIFYQIFENAFKYLNKGCEIFMNAFSTDDDILVVYKDNGKGIDEDEVEFILNKGFRGRNSKNKSGSGFGLYEANEIAKRYGGKLEVKSRNGKGFSVFITFPKSK